MEKYFNILRNKNGMNGERTKIERTFIAIGAAAGWFSVLFQFYLILENRVMSVPDTIIKFFSFFTILTNILVSVCYTSLLLRPGSGLRKWFSRPGVLTAVAVYITIVGLVYNVILRSIWDPRGLQFLVDELLHTYNPVLFVLYWLLFVSKEKLEWKQVFPWLLYPLIYLIYVMARGELTGQYPYPFLDAVEIGYREALINGGMVGFSFFITSLFFVGIGRLSTKLRNYG